MKKLTALMLALVLALSLAACGGNDGGAGQDHSSDGTNVTAPEGGNDPAQTPEGTGEEDAETPDASGNDDSGAQEEDPAAGGEDDAPQAEAAAPSHTDVTLSSAGSSFRLEPVGGSASDVTYTSADTAVATVDADGTVTAAAPGTTTVTMTLTENGETRSFDCIVRCSWQAAEEGPADTGDSSGAAAQSFQDFFAGLQADYEGLGMMMAYEGELLDNYYPGLSDIAVEEILIQETALTMANCAVALVRVSDSADVETVRSILAARAQTQADGGAWYPESCETWANAVITASGNYVGMFVYPENAQDMADAFTAAYGG